MKAFLAVAGICFSLFVAGESLKCETCLNLNGTTCSGNLTTCAANSTSCENGAMEIGDGGNKTVMAYKSCTELPECNSFFLSETMVNFTFQMLRNCCSVDNCNAEPIVLPPRNNTPNGVQCPVCYAENSTTCEVKKKMNCTGLETKCAYFQGKMMQEGGQAVTVTSRHCVSEQPCDKKWLSWPDSPFLEVTQFRCDDGSKDDDDDDDDDHHDHD